MKCTHDRTIHINAHSSDLNFVSVPHLGIEKEGYLPDIDAVCSGDDVNIEICLDCGHVIGFHKMTDKEVKEAMNIDDDVIDDDLDEGDDDGDLRGELSW